MTQELERKLTLYGLCSIAVGSSIGSGIFISPSQTYAVLPQGLLALIPWILGGIASLCGALTFAELGSRFPKSGGIYVYLKEAYGPLVGFLYGWVMLTVINTGALAALTLAFVDYLSFMIDLSDSQKQWIAIFLIVLLSAINIRGVKYSQTLASVFTTLKVLAIVFIIFVGVYLMMGQNEVFVNNIKLATPLNPINGILLAFVGVFWSYGGWHHITYLSDEIIDVQKKLPRALMISTLIIMGLYILILFSYSAMLPINQISESKRLAGDALAAVLPFGGKLVTIFISLSVFGTIAIYTMSAPRIYYAMSRDKIFFEGLSKVHARFKTPYVAIIVQSIWAIILIFLFESFSKLATYVTFMDIVFMSLAAFTVFIFRKRQMPFGKYVVKPYPLLPIVYIFIAMAFVLYTFIQLNSEALFGLAMTLIGVGVYYYLKVKNK
ncbi:MAG: hypothetical protein RLZZ546_480 [Bacteroidota bacterium]|jgi:APA family basic amino acid/polyamine antiporter